jgi:hypothetical protein
MAERVFIFYRLKPDIEREQFEQRARDIEAPLAARSPAIRRYVLTRLEGVLEGKAPAPFDYVETLDVTTLEEYRNGVTDAEVDAFIKEWEEDVAEYVLVHGRIVSEA